jgi:hypothetical protein
MYTPLFSTFIAVFGGIFIGYGFTLFRFPNIWGGKLRRFAQPQETPAPLINSGLAAISGEKLIKYLF